MTDPWGVEQPSAVTGDPPPLPPRLARLARVQSSGEPLPVTDPYAEDFPRAEELPELQSLMADGWCPLSGAPLHCLLPAAWPVEHRTWVPDRLPRVTLGGTTDRYHSAVAPALPDDEWDPHDDVARHAEDAGLPQPPRGRIWLLRSPWPRIPMTVVEDVIWSHATRELSEDEITNMYRAALDILTWGESRVLQACEPATRRLLEEWAAAGRSGESVASVIDLRISPEQLNNALARTGLDETAVLGWANGFERLDDTAVDFINSWTAAGLPAVPPPGLERYVDRDPAELRSWLDAGFDLYAADRLQYAGIETATRWRDEGFSLEETYELLRADPDLTINEARAFDASGPARDRRADWVYYGFSASDAKAWAAAGLSPCNARLWRAAGQSPSDVILWDGPPVPPRLIEGLEHFAMGTTEDGDITGGPWGDLPDPPGTRGRGARRARGDRHPWINTD